MREGILRGGGGGETKQNKKPKTKKKIVREEKMEFESQTFIEYNKICY